MRLGTPGFIGACLREAREARGLSAPILAGMLGISRAAISQYENGQASPGPDILVRLSIILGQPQDFFLKRRVRKGQSVFFRSLAGTSVQTRNRASILLDWLADIAQELSRFLQFPPVRFTPFDLPEDPLKLAISAIEEAALATRHYWGLGDGPISNMVWLLENNGAIVARGPIEEPYMDSFSRYDFRNDPVPLLFLNADKSSAVRSRFDAAHELGHWVLHRGVSLGYWSNNQKVHLREKQAHQFASAFLLPGNSFADDVLIPSLDTFLALKRKWLVSVNAMLSRCVGMGLVEEEHGQRLWRNLQRRGWRTWEPLDSDLPPEVPRLLAKAVQILTEKNPQALLELVKTLSLSEHDVAFLTMLPIEAFQHDVSNLLYFRPKTLDNA